MGRVVDNDENREVQLAKFGKQSNRNLGPWLGEPCSFINGKIEFTTIRKQQIFGLI
jgi:hypothetical protein